HLSDYDVDCIGAGGTGNTVCCNTACCMLSCWASTHGTFPPPYTPPSRPAPPRSAPPPHFHSRTATQPKILSNCRPAYPRGHLPFALVFIRGKKAELGGRGGEGEGVRSRNSCPPQVVCK